MPLYEFRCKECGAEQTFKRPMAECTTPIPHGCGGTMIRLLSADFQTCAEPFHLQDGNKMHGGRRPGTRDVFSTREQVEYRKMRDKEYEAKWRPSQSKSLAIPEND